MRRVVCLFTLLACAVTVVAAKPKFTSTWKTPAASEVSFAGRKIAALVMTKDQSLQVSGEEAMTRELTARGMEGIATYRIVPKEELTDAAKARGWFERAGVEGIVALRPVSREKVQSYNPGTWATPMYGTLWDYYGYGWGSLYIPGSTQVDTVVVIETTIYSVPRNTLLWAGVSETKNPKQLGKFVEDLAKETVKQLHKEGLGKAIAK